LWCLANWLPGMIAVLMPTELSAKQAAKTTDAVLANP
jgi:hypothetical protein